VPIACRVLVFDVRDKNISVDVANAGNRNERFSFAEADFARPEVAYVFALTETIPPSERFGAYCI